MTVDHVLPKCKGGSNDEDNLVTACERCNNMKGDSLNWYEGCVEIEAFGNPEWYRDMLQSEEEVKKPEQGKRKNGCDTHCPSEGCSCLEWCQRFRKYDDW